MNTGVQLLCSKSPLFVPFLKHVTPFDNLMLYFLEVSVISSILTGGASSGIRSSEKWSRFTGQQTRRRMYCLHLYGLIRPGSRFPTKILRIFLTPFMCYIATLTSIQIRLLQIRYFTTVWPHVVYLHVTHPALKWSNKWIPQTKLRIVKIFNIIDTKF